MRLIVVSNRLNVTVEEKEGKINYKPSSGGLATGLSSYLDTMKNRNFEISEYLWIGWPGCAISSAKKAEVSSVLLSKYKSYPVFLSEKIMDKFYLGFCNKTIWPLFHYFPMFTNYSAEQWKQYVSVNEMFCNAIIEIVKPDDIIWIHDYQLMLLPAMLRKKKPNLAIGYFHHIPFPSFEIFRLLPREWRNTILEGLLGADLVGFHTHDYTQYFLRCVLRMLGIEHDLGAITSESHTVMADTFPIGIDFEKFNCASQKNDVQKEISEFKKAFGEKKIILSVDRLDYTKGIINRLKGYELFLERYPQWHDRVAFLSLIVPSRTGVDQYQVMKRQIDEMAGKINGKFGSVNWTPLIYQFRSYSFEALAAVYSLSDVILVTPLRDGMNLVAKEFVASKTDGRGVLVLSETTGAARELGEAIMVNPNDIDELSTAIKEALELPEEEQIRRNREMQKRLKRYDITRWAEDFIKKLLKIRVERYKLETKLINSNIKKDMLEKYKNAKKRLLLLDYDGTLVPFADRPEKARPGLKLLEILKKLSSIPGNDVVIISGRDKATLEKWFGNLEISMVAEHGAWLYKKNHEWHTLKPLKNDWKIQIMQIIERCVDRLPGSFMEEKEFAVVFHYRKSDPELSALRLHELQDDLIQFTANKELQILTCKKALEIRCSGISKEVGGMHFIVENKPDFILSVGDDVTDEELFRALPETVYSVKVGVEKSSARYYLPSFIEVNKLLEEFSLIEINNNIDIF
ncbi:MAG: bifunctional alpha,alpha-trehalose-phosphate synthase (UDP-forming)/trehalose-phosphatase [Candidatus Wallbacteria bacterium]